MDDFASEAQCTLDSCKNERENLKILLKRTKQQGTDLMNYSRIQSENEVLRMKLVSTEDTLRSSTEKSTEAINAKEVAEAELKQNQSSLEFYRQKAAILQEKADESEKHKESANHWREKYDSICALAEKLETNNIDIKSKYEATVKTLEVVGKKTLSLQNQVTTLRASKNDDAQKKKKLDKYLKSAIQVIDSLSQTVSLEKQPETVRGLVDVFRRDDVRLFFNALPWKDLLPESSSLDSAEKLIYSSQVSAGNSSDDPFQNGQRFSDADEFVEECEDIDPAVRKLERMLTKQVVERTTKRPDFVPKMQELKARKSAPRVIRTDLIKKWPPGVQKPEAADSGSLFNSRTVHSRLVSTSDFEAVANASDARRKALLGSSERCNASSSGATIHGRKGKTVREQQLEMMQVSIKDKVARLRKEAEQTKDSIQNLEDEEDTESDVKIITRPVPTRTRHQSFMLSEKDSEDSGDEMLSRNSHKTDPGLRTRKRSSSAAPVRMSSESYSLPSTGMMTRRSSRLSVKSNDVPEVLAPRARGRPRTISRVAAVLKVSSPNKNALTTRSERARARSRVDEKSITVKNFKSLRRKEEKVSQETSESKEESAKHPRIRHHNASNLLSAPSGSPSETRVIEKMRAPGERKKTSTGRFVSQSSDIGNISSSSNDDSSRMISSQSHGLSPQPHSPKNDEINDVFSVLGRVPAGSDRMKSIRLPREAATINTHEKTAVASHETDDSPIFDDPEDSSSDDSDIIEMKPSDDDDFNSDDSEVANGIRRAEIAEANAKLVPVVVELDSSSSEESIHIDPVDPVVSEELYSQQMKEEINETENGEIVDPESHITHVSNPPVTPRSPNQILASKYGLDISDSEDEEEQDDLSRITSISASSNTKCMSSLSPKESLKAQEETPVPTSLLDPFMREAGQEASKDADQVTIPLLIYTAATTSDSRPIGHFTDNPIPSKIKTSQEILHKALITSNGSQTDLTVSESIPANSNDESIKLDEESDTSDLQILDVVDTQSRNNFSSKSIFEPSPYPVIMDAHDKLLQSIISDKSSASKNTSKAEAPQVLKEFAPRNEKSEKSNIRKLPLPLTSSSFSKATKKSHEGDDLVFDILSSARVNSHSKKAIPNVSERIDLNSKGSSINPATSRTRIVSDAKHLKRNNPQKRPASLNFSEEAAPKRQNIWMTPENIPAIPVSMQHVRSDSKVSDEVSPSSARSLDDATMSEVLASESSDPKKALQARTIIIEAPSRPRGKSVKMEQKPVGLKAAITKNHERGTKKVNKYKAHLRQALDLKVAVTELKRPMEEKGIVLGDSIPLTPSDAVDVMMEYLRESTAADMWAVLHRQRTEGILTPLMNTEEQNFLQICVTLNDNHQLLLDMFIERILYDISLRDSIDSKQCGRLVRLFCHAIRFAEHIPEESDNSQAVEEDVELLLHEKKSAWMTQLLVVLFYKHPTQLVKSLAYCLNSDVAEHCRFLMSELEKDPTTSDFHFAFRILMYQDSEQARVVNWLLNAKFHMAYIINMNHDEILNACTIAHQKYINDNGIQASMLLAKTAASEVLNVTFKLLEKQMNFIERQFLTPKEREKELKYKTAFSVPIVSTKMSESEASMFKKEIEWQKTILLVMIDNPTSAHYKPIMQALIQISAQVVAFREIVESSDVENFVESSGVEHLRDAVHHFVDLISEFTNFPLKPSTLPHDNSTASSTTFT